MKKRGLTGRTTVNWLVVLVVAGLLGVSVGLPCGASPAGAYQLPDTGQTKCYDNTQEIPCPQPSQAFYGQDGNYQGTASGPGSTP
jgi:hypothetical protein